jgi:DNA-binding transcriptional LysR family regulator
MSWEAWFRTRDVRFKAEAANHLQADPSYVAIEAAVKGIGVILESSILTQKHVGAGRLVSPVSEESRPTGRINSWNPRLSHGPLIVQGLEVLATQTIGEETSSS